MTKKKKGHKKRWLPLLFVDKDRNLFWKRSNWEKFS